MINQLRGEWNNQGGWVFCIYEQLILNDVNPYRGEKHDSYMADGMNLKINT